MHTEIISYSATNPGAGGIAATIVPGDSFTIKNNRGVSGPHIVDMWASHIGAGFHQLAFPSGHDTTRGYRAGVSPDDTYSLIPMGLSIPITAQELETVTIAGSGASVEVGCQLVHYPDLPGVDQRVLTWSQLNSRYEKLTTVIMTITPSALAAYSGSTALNAGGSDLLLANRDYALVGVNTTVDCAAVCIAGPDTGYARIGAPGSNQNSDEAAQYYAQLARSMDMAMIPTINSGNKPSTLITVVQGGTATAATVVTLFLALLKK